MSDTVDALIIDLLEYVACEERRYDDVIEAWHTSCPRLPVWEEANERGLVTRARTNGLAVVRITAAGVALLEQRR
jgi:D-3-phosphoglycerate dehydrogenase